MSLLKRQQDVSQFRGFPVDTKSSIATTSVSAEAVDLYFYNSGVLTIDAGEAAGTVVVAKLANNRIKNALGDVDGTYRDTSFSWGTGTILTTLVEFPWDDVEKMDMSTGTAKADVVTAGFSNGEYCIDHLTGTVYGKKATTGTSDTASYKVDAATTSGGAGTTDVAITDSDITSLSHFNADADNTAQAIKTAAGVLYDITVSNLNTDIAYVQLFDAATGDVTVGTTTPKYVLPVLAEGGTIKDWALGLTFGTAITYACTTTPTGNGDPTTGLTLSATYK